MNQDKKGKHGGGPPHHPHGTAKKPAMGVDSVYLAQALGHVLPAILRDTVEHRPSDPIEYIAGQLYRSVDRELDFVDKQTLLAEMQLAQLNRDLEKDKRKVKIDNTKEKILKLKHELHELKRRRQTISLRHDSTDSDDDARPKPKSFALQPESSGSRDRYMKRLSSAAGWPPSDTVLSDDESEDGASIADDASSVHISRRGDGAKRLSTGSGSQILGIASQLTAMDSQVTFNESQIMAGESHAPGDESHVQGDESHVPGDESHVQGDESHVTGNASQIFSKDSSGHESDE